MQVNASKIQKETATNSVIDLLNSTLIMHLNDSENMLHTQLVTQKGSIK